MLPFVIIRYLGQAASWPQLCFYIPHYMLASIRKESVCNFPLNRNTTFTVSLFVYIPEKDWTLMLRNAKGAKNYQIVIKSKHKCFELFLLTALIISLGPSFSSP